MYVCSLMLIMKEAKIQIIKKITGRLDGTREVPFFFILNPVTFVTIRLIFVCPWKVSEVKGRQPK